MGTDWKINAEEPVRTAKYDWRVPENDQQHVSQTTSPSALMIKPKDISLKPTKSPKRSGVQHGADVWDSVNTSAGADAWYVESLIV